MMLPPPNKDGVCCSAFLGERATPAPLHPMSCLPLHGQVGRRAAVLGSESQWNQPVSNPSFRPCGTLTRQAWSCSSFWDAESWSFPDSGPLTEKALLLQRQELLSRRSDVRRGISQREQRVLALSNYARTRAGAEGQCLAGEGRAAWCEWVYTSRHTCPFQGSWAVPRDLLRIGAHSWTAPVLV